MSMHLEGPWLSTTGKRRGKHKFRSAEEKRRAEQLAAEWNELQRRYGSKPVKNVRRSYVAPVNINAERSTRHIPSLNPAGGGSTAPAPVKVYTGDKMIGIGTMHKSNMVPIFSDSEARDISTMRRG